MFNLKNINKTELLFLAASLFLVVSYSTIINLYALPLTEGWYETFSWLKGKGGLYSDYYFALPPLFIDLIGIFERVTDSLLVSRLFFTFVNCLQLLSLIWICKVLTGNALASIISASILQIYLFSYMPAWLSKDYHVLVSILVNLSLVFLIRGWQAKYLINIALSGAFTGLLALTKQNVAVILFASVLVSIAINFRKIQKIKAILVYLSFVFIVLLLYSLLNEFTWVNTYIGNDSKGSIDKIIFRFIYEDNTRILIRNSFLILFSICFLYLFKNNFINSKYNIINLKRQKLEIIALPTLFFLLNLLINKNYENTIFSLSIALILFVLVLQYSDSRVEQLEKLQLISIPCIGLFYAGTLTAGFNYVSLELLVAILIANVFTIYFKFFRIRILLIFTILIIGFAVFKSNRLDKYVYGWWGYHTEPISGIRFPIRDIEYIKGIYVDEATKDIFTATNKVIHESPQDASLLAFPNIPLFYKLYDKKPFIRFPVLWFDVVPSRFNDEIFKSISNQRPEIIFWLKPAKVVYSGHKNLIIRDLLLEKIDGYLESQIKTGYYEIEFIKTIINNDVFNSTINENDLIYNNSNRRFKSIKFINQAEMIKYLDDNKIIVKNFDLYQFIILKRIK